MDDLSVHSTEPLTAEETEYVRACVWRAQFRPEIKQCFANSQRVLLLGDEGHRMQYAEGLAVIETGPIHHGWLLFGGKVVDVTLGAQGLGITLHVPDCYRLEDSPQEMASEYRGKTFDHVAVLDHMQRGWWGAMLTRTGRAVVDG